MIVDSPRLPVSVLIMTHRIDAVLTQVLESVHWAAEIIVADYGNQLEWAPLKKQFPLQVIKETGPITDFAIARNRLLKEAAQPWVLFLDSDEVLQPFDQTQLQLLLSQPQVAAATLQRLDIFKDQPLRHGEVGNVQLIRLARKATIHFERPVHEIPVVTGTVVKSELVLWHYAHPSINQFLQAVGEYARMEAYHRPLPSWFQLWLELWLWPWGKFLVNYLFKAGYKDGWRGLTYALMMTVHSLSVRAFLVERKQRD